MAGVINTTAKQFNLKGMGKDGGRVTIRVASGFNVVDDGHWLAFVTKEGKVLCPYVAELKAKKFLSFGSREDDMELEKDPDTKAKSKKVKPVKSK